MTISNSIRSQPTKGISMDMHSGGAHRHRRERGEDDTCFEKQTPPFFLAGLFHDIDIEQATNTSLKKDVIKLYGRLGGRHGTLYCRLMNLEGTAGRELGEDMVYGNHDYPVMSIRVHGDNYWSMDPPGKLFWLQGCNVAATKHPLEDLGQDDYITLGEFPVDWLVVPASGHYLSSHKVMVTTLRSVKVADKKVEGGHTQQANWDYSKVRVMILKREPTKLSELTSKNETKLDKANRKLLQPENKKVVSESGFKMEDSTKDDKMVSKLESHAGGNVEAKAKEAGTVFIFMEPNTAASTNMAFRCWDKLTKLFSASTKFVCRIIKGVTGISKAVFVLSLLVINPQMVSSVGTYNSSAVASPLAPQTLNNTPPPPLSPSPVPKGGARRLVPKMKKRSNLTESETEWGLPPKQSPPSCLPDC